MIKVLFSIVIILIFLIAFLSVAGDVRFSREFKKEAIKVLSIDKKASAKKIRESDIEKLPEQMQKYMKYTRVMGREKIKTVGLKQGGSFRLKENQRWMPIKAEQYYNLERVEFIWKGKINFAPFLSVYAIDRFTEGKGNLMVKLLGLFKIVDAKGPEVDQGEMLRFLAEAVWFPSVFVEDYFTWKEVETDAVRATLRWKNLSVSALLFFNDKNQITKIKAKRYMEKEGNFLLTDWEILTFDYKNLNGINIPTKANVIWKLPSGDFCYDRVEILKIKYNSSSP